MQFAGVDPGVSVWRIRRGEKDAIPVLEAGWNCATEASKDPCFIQKQRESGQSRSSEFLQVTVVRTVSKCSLC